MDPEVERLASALVRAKQLVKERKRQARAAEYAAAEARYAMTEFEAAEFNYQCSVWSMRASAIMAALFFLLPLLLWPAISVSAADAEANPTGVLVIWRQLLRSCGMGRFEAQIMMMVTVPFSVLFMCVALICGRSADYYATRMALV